MAYEKYIKKNGKLYGPYTYHSRRVDGKVVSEYHGPKKAKQQHIINNKKKIIYYFSGLAIILLLLWVLFFNSQITGESIVELNDYNIPMNDSGKLEIELNYGELIPSNSVLTIENLDNYYEFNLSDIMEEEPTTGDFFLEGSSLSESGEGYGMTGEKEIIKSVFFKLLVEEPTESSQSSEVPTEDASEEASEEEVILVEEKAAEETMPVEGMEEATEEPAKEEGIEEVTEDPVKEEGVPAPITGNVIGGIGSFFKNIFTGNVVSEELIIQGDVKKGEEFTYSTNSNNIVSVIEGSVKTEEKELSSSELNFENNNGEITVSTNYVEIESGFGNDYKTDEVKTYSIDLNSLGVHLDEGVVLVNINYKENNLIKFEKTISEDIIDEPIPETKENETKNDTIQEIVDEIFENQTEIITNFSKIELTEDEKNILRGEFKFIIVNTTAEDYRDKVIVSYRLGDYILENSYPKDLGGEILSELIIRDRIIFMKDLARELDSTSSKSIKRNDLDSLFPVI